MVVGQLIIRWCQVDIVGDVGGEERFVDSRDRIGQHLIDHLLSEEAWQHERTVDFELSPTPLAEFEIIKVVSIRIDCVDSAAVSGVQRLCHLRILLAEWLPAQADKPNDHVVASG